MEKINYISLIAMPIFILLIIINAYLEKNNIYDDFLEGAKEGIKIVYNLFPTLVGLFFAIGLLRNSGILDLVIKIISPVIEFFRIPKEIVPLALLRPFSGSASMAIAVDIMNVYGVDSKIGKIVSIIMGSTETTLYTITVYTSCINVKNHRGILKAALLGDFIGIVVSILMCNIM